MKMMHGLDSFFSKQFSIPSHYSPSTNACAGLMSDKDGILKLIGQCRIDLVH
jgi:hypothetical protein